MPTEIVTVLMSSVSSVALCGALLWLTRSWLSQRLKSSIEHEYNRKLEDYKHQLRLSSDAEIERLKTNLSVTAAEHAVRFSRLHEKRADAIAGVYTRLVTLRQLLKDYIRVVQPVDYPPRKEHREKLWQAFSDFKDFHITKRILLPPAVAKAVQDLHLKYVRIFNSFAARVEFKEEDDAQIENVRNLNDQLEGEVEDALRRLECEFRELLGDHSIAGLGHGNGGQQQDAVDQLQRAASRPASVGN